MIDTSELLDRVYEAALLPELWPAVLEQVDRAIGTDAGILFVADGTAARWAAVEPLHETMEAFIAGGFLGAGRNPRAERAMAGAHLGVLTDLDLLTIEEVHKFPFFTELMHPRGWGWAAGTVIMLPTGETCHFNFEKKYVNGPASRETVSRLGTLLPHLSRAALMSCRLQLENLRSSVSSLDALGIPAAVIGQWGRILVGNSHFDSLGDTVIARAHGGFALKTEQASALVHQALEDVRKGHGAPRSIASPGDEVASPAVFHVLPIRRQAQDLFSGGEALLIVTLVGQPKGPPYEVLRALFDLTPGEGRIARLLTSGKDVSQMALELGVSVLTVRTQIKRVLQKTGMHRQTDLVGFLAGLGRSCP